MKILYTTKEARYEWSYEDQGNDNYLVTIFY